MIISGPPLKDRGVNNIIKEYKVVHLGDRDITVYVKDSDYVEDTLNISRSFNSDSMNVNREES